MRAVLLVLPLLAACAPVNPEVEQQRTASREAELSSVLAGYTKGETKSCIQQREIRSSRIITGTAIVYEGLNGRLYVNRAGGDCAALVRDRTLVTRTPSDQLCRGDIVRVVDMPSRIEYGSCGLGDFEEYSRARQGS